MTLYAAKDLILLILNDYLNQYWYIVSRSLRSKRQWISIKIQNSLPRKCIWKWRLQHDGHFVEASVCWTMCCGIYHHRSCMVITFLDTAMDGVHLWQRTGNPQWVVCGLGWQENRWKEKTRLCKYMTSGQRNDSGITSPLWGETIGHRRR